MGKFAIGDVIAIPFPFSDLSATKKRPALVVARTEDDNVILCQITSRRYNSRVAIPIGVADFTSGGLPLASFVRPGKLFTASESIATTRLGTMNSRRLQEVRAAIITLFEQRR